MTSDPLSTIVGWIGIAAFLLAIPMAVVANLLTPRVQNWWAGRNKKAAAKRLDRLANWQRLVADAEPNEHVAFILRQALYALGYFFAATLYANMVFAVLILRKVNSISHVPKSAYLSNTAFTMLPVILSVALFHAVYLTYSAINRTRLLHKQGQAKALQDVSRDIEKLRLRL